MDRPNQPLTQKQEDFVEAFIENNFDPIKAFKAAGYADAAERWVYQKSLEQLRKPAIVRAIKERLTKASPAHWITEDQIISKLWREATDYSSKSSQGARINALVWIGKHFGMFQEKQKQDEKDVTYNIINYSDYKEIQKEVNKPEVLEHKDGVTLPEGVVLTSYSDPFNGKN
jgi:hypothetical protein